ncbi:MAG: PVC-type heme-binding CxxCH protein [Planctomycetota bacterium]
MSASLKRPDGGAIRIFFAARFFVSTTIGLSLVALSQQALATSPGPGPYSDADPRANHAVLQSLLRIPESTLADYPQRQPQVMRALRELAQRDPGQFVRFVKRLGVTNVDDELLRIASREQGGNVATQAARQLFQLGHGDKLAEALEGAGALQKPTLMQTIASVDSTPAAKIVLPYLMGDSTGTRVKTSPTLRAAAALALGKNWHGQQQLLELARRDEIPASVKFIVGDSLRGSWTKEIAAEARKLKSLEPALSGAAKPLPPIRKLASQRGDVARGRKAFLGKGTCGNCHQVGKQGKNVGPDLSEIGSKLSREDMYVAILQPSAAISHNYETYSLLDFDGRAATGLLIGENEQQVTLRSADGTDITVPREEIDVLKKSDVSLMPADLQKNLSQQDLVDIVEYMGLLKRKDQARFDAAVAKNKTPRKSLTRTPDEAIPGFSIADGLRVQLFAYEPMMFSPTAIDVDHRGRVWVCEAVNYRHFRNTDNPPRTEGDRILVMEDTDGDGQADKRTVFYQGQDINSPHGVCVLGDRVIVSAGDSVLVLTDSDGDAVADDKKRLFTGISGVDHDHGIHSFMPGPDGKLYFNFGNEGKQIRHADGSPITDLAGNVVDDSRQPYQQGMVFRCDLDGSNFETLGWNFRNNWEVAVDSFGTMWQSDNDDDGNRGTRINFVMEFGNYGYRDEQSGDQWRSERIGMAEEIPRRHWHLNDPGVVPNLLQTGAGSPTGMMIYEGKLLPEVFRNQMIHTDPGPNVVRAYPVQAVGAGYGARTVNLIQGVQDPWFRPVDAVAAPDGSVIVADWYDPGVGGHRMGDVGRGRLFRVTTDDCLEYKTAPIDFDSTDGNSMTRALAALESPNVETRFLAHMKLRQQVAQSPPRVANWLDPATVTDDRIRARRMWVLSKVDATSADAIDFALNDPSADVRIAAIRAARQTQPGKISQIIDRMSQDPSIAVARECLIALRHADHDKAIEQWIQLAQRYDGKDRWYLEALGIAGDTRWDALFPRWIASVGDAWSDPAGRQIVWRVKDPAAAPYLVRLIGLADSIEEQERYFRALDLIGGPAIQTALQSFVAR